MLFKVYQINRFVRLLRPPPLSSYVTTSVWPSTRSLKRGTTVKKQVIHLLDDSHAYFADTGLEAEAETDVWDGFDDGGDHLMGFEMPLTQSKSSWVSINGSILFYAVL